MEIESENVKSYIFFLTDKYAEGHYSDLLEMCRNLQLLSGCSVIKFLTFCLAFFEQRFENQSFIVVALTELLEGAYERALLSDGSINRTWAYA